MCLSPLSPPCAASFPQVLESSGPPPVPNPILESQVLQSFSLLPRIPILALTPCLSWSLPSCSYAERKTASQAGSSTHCDPEMWRGISHQQSMRTENSHACRWGWSESDSQSSYQDRSWKRAFSSRLVAWSPVRPTQSLPREGYSRSCCSIG